MEHFIFKQRNISMKHLSVLRRSIMQQQSGNIRFVSSQGYAGKIGLHQGVITQETSEMDVSRFLAGGMQTCNWMEMTTSVVGSSHHQMPQLLIDGLEKSNYCMNTMTAMKDLFGKLPYVKIRLMPVVFTDYRDEVCYHLLHQQANQQQFTPAMFLDQVKHEETLRQRLKILTFTYCLGLMVPNKQERPARRSRRESLLQRIFQRVIQQSVGMFPNQSTDESQDSFGNTVLSLELTSDQQTQEINAHSRVVTTNAVSCGPESGPDSRHFCERWKQFLAWSPAVPELSEYRDMNIGSLPSMNMSDIEFGHNLYEVACGLFKNLKFDPAAIASSTDVRSLLNGATGSSHDFAHAMIGFLRSSGIPARFALGYIFNPRLGDMGDQVRGANRAFGWVQAWHEGYGWIGVDPTNQRLVDWQYVRSAVGRDYSDVPPCSISHNTTGLNIDSLVQVDLI